MVEELESWDEYPSERMEAECFADVKAACHALGVPLPFQTPEIPAPPVTDHESTFASARVRVSIPRGRAFQPSSGSDNEAWALLRGAVTGIDSADPFNGPPKGAATIGARGGVSHRLEFGGVCTIAVPAELPDLAHAGELDLPVRRHFFLDSLATLVLLDQPISVLFYSGDSSGEGGSNQGWLGLALLPFTLRYLLDGGLIVTDGSDATGVRDIDETMGWWRLPWRPLLAPDQSEQFDFAGRQFRNLGPVVSRRQGRTLHAWQVKSIEPG